MMPDLTHILMEQTMRYGRTIKIAPADAMVTSHSGAAPPQMVAISLTGFAGKPTFTNVIPTHATDGRQLQDEDWKHFFTEMSDRMHIAESNPE